MAVRDTAHRKLTYEDYLLFPEDRQRHEILDGEHYVTPAPSMGHQGVSMYLSEKLGFFVREHRLGRVFAAPADLLFVSNERAAILTQANVQGAPDLLIEILSDSTRRRDETLKRDRYERAGVREYWIVDPRRRVVRVFTREGDDGFRAPQEFSAVAGDVLTTALLPGLEIRVSEIFE
jgi:Uma2 family endonuclease